MTEMKQCHALEEKFYLTSTDCRQNNYVQHIVKVLWNRVALFFLFCTVFYFSLVFENASYEFEKETPI